MPQTFDVELGVWQEKRQLTIILSPSAQNFKSRTIFFQHGTAMYLLKKFCKLGVDVTHFWGEGLSPRYEFSVDVLIGLTHWRH